MPEPHTEDVLLTQHQVAGKLGVSTTTLWRMERRARARGLWFPRKCKISARRVGWLASEIDTLFARIVAGQHHDVA